MQNFIIYEDKKIQNYDMIAYSTSFVNPLSDIKELSNELHTEIRKIGYILFDLLLSNGESFNRFVVGYYNGNELERNSLQIIEINDDSTLKDINSFYKENKSYLNKGVLTSSQKYRYALGR